MPVQHRFIQTPGARIHAVEQGEGPLVILIHGFPESWYSWRHQLPFLAAAGYRGVAIDGRGYGESSKFVLPGEFRIDRLVSDVVGVIDYYDEPAVVIGHDWGAPLAWTAAWLHPEKIRGVVGLSVPFAGRALVGLPGNAWGEKEPNNWHDELAGPGKTFYQTYFGERDGIIREIEEDVRGWLLSILYSVSGEAIGAAAAAGMIPDDPIEAIRQGALCMPEGSQLKNGFATPEILPDWLGEDDLNFYASEFQRSGFGGPLSYYHQLQAGWEFLADQADKPLTPPACFIGGEFDVATAWGVQNMAEADQHASDYRGSHIVAGSGHWIQQEKPRETNQLLMDFLRKL